MKANSMIIKTPNFEFKRNKSGLLYRAKKADRFTRICDFVKIKYEGATEDGNQWLVVCQFRDKRGKLRELSAARETLYETDTFAKLLIKAGLDFEIDFQKKAFREFVHATTPSTPVTLFTTAGWCGDDVFFRGRHRMPKTDKHEKLLPSLANDLACIRTKGKLSGWKKHVAAHCIHSPLLILSICMSFSAPLLKLLDIESGGFHVYAIDSTGKTTCLFVAASVVGFPPNYSIRWDATKVGIEEQLPKFNDLPFLPDDLVQLSQNPRELKETTTAIAYMIGNGRTRKRARVYEEAHKIVQKDFRVSVLSNGEMSMASVAEKVGDKRFGGEEVRIIDLSANLGGKLGIYTSGVKTKAEAGQLSDQLKEAASNFYGTPFESFMQAYFRSLSDDPRHERAKQYLNDFLGAAKSNEHVVFHHRFAKRFAVVYAAGALACDFGILDWGHEMIFDAMMKLYVYASHERGSTQADHLKNAVKLVRNKLHAAEGFVKHSGNSAIKGDKSTYENHRGVKMLDDHGNTVALKVQRTVLKNWCGSSRMTEAVIAWFVEKDLVKNSEKRCDYVQRPHWQLAGTKKNKPKRPRYITFHPKAARRNKKTKTS